MSVSYTHLFTGKVTILVTGPLTNIALALHINRNFLREVKELIVLGGTYQGRFNPMYWRRLEEVKI